MYWYITAGIAMLIMIAVTTGIMAARFLTPPSPGVPADALASPSLQTVRNTDTPSSSARRLTTDSADTPHALEAKEIELLREEKKRLEREIEGIEQLREEKRKLEADIKHLISRLHGMKAWTTVDLVLSNPTHFAIGLKHQTGSSAIVLLKAEGETALGARFVAQKHGVPDFSGAPDIVQAFFRRYAEGTALSDSDYAQLMQFWKLDHQFLPVSKTQPIEFIAFRDARTKRSRLGILEKVEPDNSLAIWSLASGREIIKPADVYPGSARKGTAQELDYLLQDTEFLDSCLIRAVQMLQSDPRNAIPSFIPTLTVEVQVDVAGMSRGLRDSDQILFDNSFALSSEQAQRYTLNTVATYLEDEIIARLSRVPGIRLMERENIAAVLRELPTPPVVADYLIGRIGQLASRESTVTFGDMFRESITAAGICKVGELLQKDEFRRACPVGTCLIVELKPPTSGGMYHLSMRLIETRHGEIVWAIDGERHLAAPGEHYILQSGEPVQVTFKDAQYLAAAFESQRLMISGVKEARSPLIILEKVEADTVLIRPLFSIFSTRAPRSAFSKVGQIKDPKTVLEDSDKLRMLLHRISAAILPPAGRITVDGDTATVNLGKRHHLHEGQRFKVLEGSRSNDGVPRTRAVDLVITQVDQEKSLASINRNGVWDHERTVSTDDIAVLRSAHLPVIRIPPVKESDISPRTAAKLRYTLSRARANQLSKQRSAAAESIRASLINGLTTLNIPVVAETEERPTGYVLSQHFSHAPSSNLASHEVIGEISFTDSEDVYDLTWQVRLAGSQESLLTHSVPSLRVNLGK